MTTTRRSLLARTALAAPAVALTAIPALSGGAPAPALPLAPPAGDPAAEIGRDLARAWREHDAADDADDTVRQAEAEEMIDWLEDALQMVQARTLVGCMAQIVLAHVDVEGLEGCHDPERVAAMTRRIRRCLYSVLTALEERSLVSRAEVAGERYMPARLDPWLAMGRARP